MSARFAVGIDLGTTNTVVAWSEIDGAASGARVFEVPQLVAAGEVAAKPVFPSALYAPFDDERFVDPFGDSPWVLGEYARRRGIEVPGRLVASSKSWLAYADVDRNQAILPWGAGDDVPKVSPVDAAARLLEHVRRAWDSAHENAPLDEQEVVLTVPASFDEVGRELTIEAAGRAGIAPKLLEEPQAAFYDWMSRTAQEGLGLLLQATGGEALVLVVDVGGGTTDLSLLRVSRGERVDRVAVGPHLLLGGDNMDLALAHSCSPRLCDAENRLDPGRFAQLVASCRAAKESILGESGSSDSPVAIAGAGASLVGGTRTTRVTREEVERIVLDGFWPLVAADAKPLRARGALVAFGLPYERDAAITRHVAAFISRHLPEGTLPNAVLLTGGVFRAKGIANRLMATLSAWSGGRELERLANVDPSLGVACGAVAYAFARRGHGIRIGGGAGRGYFVGIAGTETIPRAVCVVPRGAEEGTVHIAGKRTFELAVGSPTRFELFASHSVGARAGDIVDVDDERFSRLPPLATTIDISAQSHLAAGLAQAPTSLQVSLEGELTPVGTLDLACVEVQSNKARRFRLAFQLRKEGPDLPVRPPAPAAMPKRIEAACDLIDFVFGKPRTEAIGRAARDLLRRLEQFLGERAQWTIETNRALFDALLPYSRARRRSADHERVFWLLAGWCIRPGFADPLDSGRVRLLTALFDERLAFPGEARGWQQFWITWRRVAGGLDERTQTIIRDFVDAHLAPVQPTRKRPKKPALSLDDALEMAALLERVPPPRRVELGDWVLERTWTDRDPRLWAAMGRIGARAPSYASAHHVVAPHVAERWLDHLLREKWHAVPTAAQAAMRLARRTGDRARDVSDAMRREVERQLVAVAAAAEWVKAVREVVPVAEHERVAFFGDALPLGLRLVD